MKIGNELKARYVERTDLPETFATVVKSIFVADGVAHIELCTTMLDQLHPPQAPTGKVIPVARLALAMPAFVSLIQQGKHHLAEMEKAGLLKMAPGPQPTQQH